MGEQLWSKKLQSYIDFDCLFNFRLWSESWNENGKGESDNNSEIEMSDNTKSTDFNISYGIEEVKQNDFNWNITVNL